MGKFNLGLGLKKQGSKTLSGADPNPTPGNPYPMASGGHHAGRLGSRDQTHPPAQPSQQASSNHPAQPSGSADYPDEQAAVAAAMAASELAAQEPGRPSEHRSAGQQQEEQAMLDLAIKVGTSLKPIPSSIVCCIARHTAAICQANTPPPLSLWKVVAMKASMMLGSAPVPAARSVHIKFLCVYTCMYTCVIYICVHAYGPALQAMSPDHHASAQCKPGSSTEDLHVMQESEVQAEYDNILREAKLLRMDLQHAVTKCLEHRVCTWLHAWHD